VGVAALDQHQRPGLERHGFPVDDGLAGAGDDEQPLISTAVAVVRPALSLAWGERYLGRLGVLVA
jgi:hypothetical protein